MSNSLKSGELAAKEDQTNTTTTWVIGDIHNQLNALQELLTAIPTDPLIFVGDIIHKGPAEACEDLVDLVKDLVDSGRAVVVRGNHDSTAGKGRFVSDEGTLRQDQVGWLKSRPLFVRRGGVLVMHAGIDASVSTQLDTLISGGHLPREGDWTPEMVDGAVATLNSKSRKRLEKCMYVRYVSPLSGKMVVFGNETAADPYWAQEYDGRYGHVYFGHNPWRPGPAWFAHATGVDCGAGTQALPVIETPPVSVLCGTGEGLVAVDLHRPMVFHCVKT